MRLLYDLALFLLFPFIILRLFLRARKQPDYLSHVGERFGFYDIAPGEEVIWLHAVSVGETRAAAPLVEQLIEAHPECSILVTHMTPTGRETGKKLFEGKAVTAYLPYDYPFAVRRFLKHFRPKKGLLMETELWFNLIHQCREENIPLFLVNARLSQKSLEGYMRIGKLARNALNELEGIAAQTEQDAARLRKLGAEKVSVCGNLKFDVSPPENIPDFRPLFPGKRVFLAASTREGEEELILDAFSNMEGLLLVIVPRHPQRFPEIENMLKSRAIRYAKRSENRRIDPETEVFLGDSMGEMYAYYASCDCAFIGGSLLPFGGQNLIEAASMGKPAFLGPHTYNFEEASEAAIQAGAAIRVGDARELAREVSDLLADPEKLKEMGGKGIAFAENNRGAAGKIMGLIGAEL